MNYKLWSLLLILMQFVVLDIWFRMLLMNLYAKRSLLFAFDLHPELEKLISASLSQ